MFIRYASLALLLTFIAPAAAQPLAIDLAVSGGGTSADVGEGVAVAPDGSYYVAGTFEGTASFGDLSLTSAGDSDAFLVKYDPDGEAVWARRSGTDVFWDYGRDVAVDAEGNVYYAGNFTGIATWDGGANPDVELTTRDDWDGFVAKYTAEGDLEWVQQLGGGGQDAANAVAVGPDGTVFVGGGFVGPGIFGDVTLPGAGDQDGFVAALAPADGDVLWAASAGGTDSDVIYGVDLDAEGGVYVAGQYRGVASVFGTPFQSNGLSDVFVAKLDADGEGVWAVAFGGAGSEYARGLGVSPAGHAVVTGSFEQSVLVNEDILTSAGASDVLVAAVDPDGELAWGRRGGGDEFDFSEDAAVDAEGNVYVTGYVVGTGSFGSEPYAAVGFDDVFLAAYDVAGELLHLDLAGGTNRDQGKGVALGNGRFAMTGSFRGTATFGDIELTGPGSNDVFLAAGEALGVEGPNPVIYVDADATGAEDGSSWTDAFTDLQDALALAATMDGERQIWVAEGTYTPTDDGDRTVSFELQSGLALYGGFDGTETELDQRDWETNETVLSGDVGTTDDHTDNSYSVVKALDVEASTLSGFTIAHGRGSGSMFGSEPEYRARGGGLQLVGGSLTVSHCIFRENWVLGEPNGGDYIGRGGGLYSEGATLTLESVLFDFNVAAYPGFGGGMYSIESDVELTDTDFVLNNASHSGGGLHFQQGSISYNTGRFTDNRSPGSPAIPSLGGKGGGLYLEGSTSEVVLSGLHVEGNTAHNYGGGIFSLQSAATFRNLVVTNNTAAQGAGMYDEASSNVLIGALFHQNIALGWEGGGMAVVASSPVLTGAHFVGNFAPAVGGAMNVEADSHPILVNSIAAGNHTGGVGGGFNVSGSITLVNSMVSANTSDSPGGMAITSSGDATLRNTVFWGNTFDEIQLVGSSSSLVASHILIEGGCPTGSTCSSILDSDPLFVRNPDPGSDGEWGTDDDDYGDLRLQEGSPAIDFGLAEFLPPDTYDLDGDGDTEEPLPIDLDGDPRVQGNEVDLGAYESPFAVALEPGTGVPAQNSLAAAYPNPFRSATTLALDVAEAQTVTVEVFDVLGRLVVTVHDGPLDVGEHRVVIEAGALPAGVYVVRAEGESFRQAQRVTLVR